MNRNKSLDGFTLIELLVVIIIIGILSAIALPSFLGQASKARQAEAKQNVGSAIRGQSSYYLENQSFATDWDDLSLGIPQETTNYKYSFLETESKQPITEQIVFANAIPKDLKSYVGGVRVVERSGSPTVISVQCEAKKQGVQLSKKSIILEEKRIKCGDEARETR